MAGTDKCKPDCVNGESSTGAVFPDTDTDRDALESLRVKRLIDAAFAANPEKVREAEQQTVEVIRAYLVEKKRGKADQ